MCASLCGGQRRGSPRGAPPGHPPAPDPAPRAGPPGVPAGAVPPPSPRPRGAPLPSLLPPAADTCSPARRSRRAAGPGPSPGAGSGELCGPPAALPLPSHGSNFSRAAVARRGRPLVSAGPREGRPRCFLAVLLRAGGARPVALPAGLSRVGPAVGGSAHPPVPSNGLGEPRPGREERGEAPRGFPGVASLCPARPRLSVFSPPTHSRPWSGCQPSRGRGGDAAMEGDFQPVCLRGFVVCKF